MSAPDAPYYYQLSIQIPPSFRESLVRRLALLGSLGVIEGDDDIIAYFSPDGDLQSVLQELDIIAALVRSADPAAHVRVAHTRIGAADWNAEWKKSFRPLDIGERFTILPPWERQTGERLPLIIDPGMAFGTGHHETTRSCLILMERYLTPGTPGRFLDVGTGSGLLAIAARKLGFRHVEAIDRDAGAIIAARTNLALNQTEDIELRSGGIASAGEGYTMIAANLISGTLIALAPEIARRLVPRGVAILSGILQGQESDVVSAMEQAGLRVRELLRDGKWVSIVVQKS